MRPTFFLPSLAAAALMVTGQAVAATVTFSSFNGGSDLMVVEADEFAVGGTAGNTVFDGGAPVTGTTTRAQGSFGDEDTWKYRSSTNGDTGAWGGVPNEFTGVYSSFGNGATDNADLTLTTSVSGLASNTYNVFAIYLARNDVTIDGGIAAALSGAALVDYADVAGASGGSGISLGVVGGEEAAWTAFAVKIGTVTGTSIDVDAGVLSTTDTGAGVQRNTYIGVGYQIVPEPGSLALLGLGGLMLVRRRRG